MSEVRWCLLSLAIIGLTVTACERGTRETANRPKQQGMAAYNTEPSAALLPGKALVASVAPKDRTVVDGASLYTANCAACHQAAGQGVPGAFPPLDGSSWVQHPENMAPIMLYGLMGPIEVKGMTYQNVMAPMGHLKDEELAAIATYVRGAWSNKLPPVGPEVFKEARAKFGTRAMMTVAELPIK